MALNSAATCNSLTCIPVAIGMHVKELQVAAELTTVDLSNNKPTIDSDGVELRLDTEISHQTN